MLFDGRLIEVQREAFTDNGLGSIERLMLDEPEAEFYVIAKINRRRALTDDDTGDTTPTGRILRIEPLTGVFERVARQLLDFATLKRTSAGTLDEHSTPEPLAQQLPGVKLASVPFDDGGQADDD